MWKSISKLATALTLLMIFGILGEVALREHAIGATSTSNFAALLHPRDTSCAYQVPVTTSSVTADPRASCLQWKPAGTIAAGTVTLPKAVSDGFIWEFSSTAQVTSMTFAAPAGATVLNGATQQVSAGVGKSWRYRASDATWYPRY